jgi:hypothetical protein
LVTTGAATTPALTVPQVLQLAAIGAMSLVTIGAETKPELIVPQFEAIGAA